MTYDYIKNRSMFYSIAGVLILISLISAFMVPFNLGIDMTGGTQTEYTFAGAFDLDGTKVIVDEAKKTIVYNGSEVVNNTNVYKISGENMFVVEAGFHRPSGISDKDYDILKTKFKETITDKFSKIPNSNIAFSRYINIGESFGDYIKQTAYWTILFVIIAISFYIAYAFSGSIEGFSSFSFASVTAASLFHDVIIAFGLYHLTSFFFPEYKIDTYFITAMLTVLGYSINDTIVVMDRIRSNLKLPENKKKAFDVIVNLSINDTMTRSIFTSLTVFIVLLAMFFFGPITLKGFVLTLLFGTVVGTYSSVTIAAPLLHDITKGPQEDVKK